MSRAFVTTAASLSRPEQAPEVHALVFRGIDPTSVFTRTEWPVIRHRLLTGAMGALVVHLYELDEAQTGLQEVGTRRVTSPMEWNKLPQVARNQDGRDQQRLAHASEQRPDRVDIKSALAGQATKITE